MLVIAALFVLVNLVGRHRLPVARPDGTAMGARMSTRPRHRARSDASGGPIGCVGFGLIGPERIGLSWSHRTAGPALARGFGMLPHDPIAQRPAAGCRRRPARYWFGTDQFGRDIAARTPSAACGRRCGWPSSSVAIAAVHRIDPGHQCRFLPAAWVDQIVGRFVDILFAFPAILLALAVVTALGSGWQNTAIAIAVVYTPIFARVSRGPTLSVGAAEYIKAQRVLGIPLPRILLRHVLPNVARRSSSRSTLALSWAILTESALSFLGLGTQPPDPAWA